MRRVVRGSDVSTTEESAAKAPRRLRSRVKVTFDRRLRRIWMLNLSLMVAAAAGTSSLFDFQPVLDFPAPWWALAGFFYAAEIAVVHLKFRKDAHSFSMSDIPLVLGLIYASPVQLITAQAIGNLVALTLHRRLPPVKLFFNIGQFALQSIAAIWAFRLVWSGGEVLGANGWIAIFAATGAALLVADGLINVAIRLSGGNISLPQMLQVLSLSALATTMNTMLGLAAITIMNASPNATWLAFAPPLFMFLAYRGYTRLRQERDRIAALFAATQALHRAPDIEQTITAACEQASQLLQAESSTVIITGQGDGPCYRTAVEHGAPTSEMERLPPWMSQLARSAQASLQRLYDAEELTQAGLVDILPGRAREAVAAPIPVGDRAFGFLVVADPIGDVSRFTDSDSRFIATLASQLGVSLEKGELEVSLEEITTLKDQLERSIASKDSFIASVSHELRTPLTGVVGLAKELHDNFDAFADMEVQDVIAMIADQGAELSNIIEDLLVAARADIGTLSIATKPIDLRDELQLVVESHVRSHEHGHIEIHGDSPTVHTDPLRLRQIVRNLLTNAYKYGGDDVWVEVTTRRRDAVLAVCDNGDGVPAGEETQIFEAYHSAHVEPTQPGSFGLGLSVAKTIAEMAGGTLTYQRRGEVTSFELTMPLKDHMRAPGSPPARLSA